MENRPFMRRFLKIFCLIVDMGRIELSSFAASSAFFLFLSLIPILLLLCSVIPFTGISQTELLRLLHDSVADIAPEVITDMIQSTVASIYSGGALTLSLSALATLWTASKAFLALMRGMDVIHGAPRANYLIARLKSCLYTMVMVSVIVFMLAGVVFGKKLVYFIGGYIPSILPPLRWIVRQRFWMAWILLACVFTGIYTWVPNKKLHLREQLPGAVFSSGAWIGFSALFSMYLNHSAAFGIYGSLTTIIIALLWMYYCMYILLLGTYLNVKF